MFSGLLLILFVEDIVCFCKNENITIYLFIYTIQPFFFNSKLAPIFAQFFFFFCVLPSL